MYYAWHLAVVCGRVPVHGAYCVNIKMLWEIINEPSSFPVQVKTADTHNFLCRINIVAMNWWLPKVWGRQTNAMGTSESQQWTMMGGKLGCLKYHRMHYGKRENLYYLYFIDVYGSSPEEMCALNLLTLPCDDGLHTCFLLTHHFHMNTKDSRKQIYYCILTRERRSRNGPMSLCCLFGLDP